MSHRSAIRLSLFATLFAIFGFATQAASAATLTVDNDHAQCPAAAYTSIQSAVDAASPGDTLVVCDGTYSEGSGAQGTNGLTITKSLTIKGAGADKVTIQPTRATPTGGDISAASPVLRDGVGNIVSINGTPEAPLTVNISGVTVSGGGDKENFDDNATPPIWNGEFKNGVASEAGVLYLDAGGSFTRSLVTNVVTSEKAAAFSQVGGYRNGNLGWGLAKVTAATAAPSAASVPIQIKGSRFERYNKGGILIDGATNDSPPLTASGNPSQATVTNTTVVGRLLNSTPYDGWNNASTLITADTVFGQDGIRVTSGSSVNVNASDIFQNLPAGTNAALIGSLNLAAGIRLIDAAASSATESNIIQNGFGIYNVQADGSTANTAVPVTASNDWWGVNLQTGTVASGTPNSGPQVSPASFTGWSRPNNPVNGAADLTYGSDAVHFTPFRPGNEADSNAFWPVQDTPVQIVDADPTVDLSSNKAKVAPGESLTLTADAADDFGVKSIKFITGTSTIGTPTPPANTATWTAPSTCGAPQTVTFRVYVTDSDGKSETDSVTVDVDDCAPTVDLTAVANPNAPLGSIKLSANVSDDIGVSTLKYYVDGDLVYTDSAVENNAVNTYIYSPADTCGGGHQFNFEVVATDSSTPTPHTVSDTASFTQDDCSPVVDLAADDTSVEPGATVNLTATAEDDDVVVGLTYLAGSTPAGTSTNTGSDNPWVDHKSWTAPNQCGTSTVVSVTAEDSNDQTATDSVTVTTTACPDNPPTVDLGASATTVDPGGQVTLTATATDDNGVVSIEFFQGSTSLGSVTPPANSKVWTAPETCDTSYTLKAVAKDTANQTTEDTVTVTVNACPPPAEPTVSIDSPPATIAQGGTTVSATASGEAGVSKVTFFLGTRQVCEDTSAPYSCNIVPNGGEIGPQSIRAVVTDELDRTAEDLESVTVAKFKPKGLTATAKRVGKNKKKARPIRITGKLRLPSLMTAAQGCSASKVAIKAKLGGKTLARKKVSLSGCAYSLTFKAPKTKKKQRVVITVRFPGNSKLTATSKIRKVR